MSRLLPEHTTSDKPELDGSTTIKASRQAKLAGWQLVPRILGAGLSLHPPSGLGSEREVIFASYCSAEQFYGMLQR